MKALNMANAVTETFFGNEVSVIFGRKWKIAQNFDPLNSKITDNYINKKTFFEKSSLLHKSTALDTFTCQVSS